MKFKRIIKESSNSIEMIKIKQWLDKVGIINYTINEDGTVDVNGDVDLEGKKLKEIPVQFGFVDGSFYCGINQLTSLRGSPEKVGGGFYCNDNQLTSLEGSPETVSGSFYCSNNSVNFSESDVMNVCEVDGNIYV